MAPPRRSGRGGGNWALVVVCVLFLGVGAYYVWRGIDAAVQGVLVPGGSRIGPMSGSTAIIVGICAGLAGAFGLWLLARGAGRKH